MSLLNLENQTRILQDIQNNTEIGLENQKLGLNASDQNHALLEEIVHTQELVNQTLQHLKGLGNMSDLS
jgi:hypothetical protein